MSKRLRGSDLVYKATTSPLPLTAPSLGQAAPAPSISIRADAAVPPPATTGKRAAHLSWDDYFMALAALSAQRSKGA